MNADEVVSCSDDHKLIFWNAITHEQIRVIDLPNDLFPSDLHCYPKISGSSTKGSKSYVDVIALGSSNGKLHLFSVRLGKLDKSTDAHTGAVLCIRWSPDGSALASGGEDGCIKIWSKNGMLRSTLASQSSPIYALCWSPTSDSLVYCIDRRLEVKPLSPTMKSVSWKAGDGLILKVSWNSNNGRIISGGEDCRYKIWDSMGRLLFTSMALEHPVTSLNWSPDGTMFAVGSFNCLKLCDESGWSYCTDKPQVHSLFALAWSNDSLQVAAATSTGHILISHVINKSIEWKSFQVVATARKVLSVKDVTSNTLDELDFKDNVTKFGLAFGHLLAITSTQCFIYKTSNFNTPHVFDLKDQFVQLVLQSDKHFMIVDSLNVALYSYEGRFLVNIKWPGMKVDGLNRNLISLSSDTVVIRDSNDSRIIHMIDSSAKPINTYKHRIEVIAVVLDFKGMPSDRKCCFVDKNADLYILQVRTVLTLPVKLSTMIRSMKWNEDCNIFGAFEEFGKLLIWIYPQAAFVDRELLPNTVVEKDSTVFGSHFKQLQLCNFHDSKISVRRSDGSLISTSINSSFIFLHELVSDNKFEEGLKLCRYLSDSPDGQKLWSSFAGMSLVAKELSYAEIAYSEIDRVDKVLYIQQIKHLEDSSARNGEILLISGRIKEAENLFISSGFLLRLIKLHVDLFNWSRALELAQKYSQVNPQFVPMVLYHRKIYLEKFGKKELNQSFLKAMSEIDSLPDSQEVEDMCKDLYVKTEMAKTSKR